MKTIIKLFVILNIISLISGCKPKKIEVEKVSGKIVFESDRTGDLGIYILVNGEYKLIDNDGITPKWSPDGKKIVYRDYTGIAIINENGSNKKYLFLNGYAPQDLGQFINIDPKSPDYYKPIPEGTKDITYDRPSFSPDGKKIMFTSNFKDKKESIFIMDLETNEIKNLSENLPSKIRQPRWSPDGTKIAFVANKYPDNPKDERPTIYIINSDGTGLRDVLNLLGENGFGLEPSWSPDGQKIAYVTSGGKEYTDVFIIDIDGKNNRRLTDTYWQERRPSWSPDGKRIIYASFRHETILGGSELFAINIDGSDEIQLTPPARVKVNRRRWATDDSPDWHE